MNDLKLTRLWKENACHWPRQEDKLVVEVQDLRKVGDRVSGMWMKARMKQLVDTDFKDATGDIARKRDSFKASGRWLEAFADRKGLSYKKKRTRKADHLLLEVSKSESSIGSLSTKLENFHLQGVENGNEW